MPIFKIAQKNILFIHIPKTGGTSIERWLAQAGPTSLYSPKIERFIACVPQHLEAEAYRYLFDNDFFDYKFTIIRNPYARIVSEYRYRITQGRMNRLMKPSFRNWFGRKTRQFKSGDGYVLSNHIRPQSEFILDNTELFRFEEGLDKAKQAVENKLQLDSGLMMSFENKSKSQNVRLNQKSADLVYEFYKGDFERFGYDKDTY